LRAAVFQPLRFHWWIQLVMPFFTYCESVAAQPRWVVRSKDKVLPVIRASSAEIEAHETRLDAIDRSSGGRTIWRNTN
jgi:hypothetical protein